MADAPAVWVRTEPSASGNSYVVRVRVGDHVRTLARREATAYAQAVLAAAATATYDAAILRQATKLSGQGAGAELVGLARAERGNPMSARATDPLRLEPGVSLFDGTPFIHVFVDGATLGQWSVDDATHHAVGVLQAAAAADLDTAYLHTLTRRIGLDSDTARAAVADIGSRQHQEGGDG